MRTIRAAIRLLRVQVTGQPPRLGTCFKFSRAVPRTGRSLQGQATSSIARLLKDLPPRSKCRPQGGSNVGEFLRTVAWEGSRATISVRRRFRRVIRRRIEPSDANHPCRDPSSSGSGHRAAAQVGHVLQIQPRADLAQSRGWPRRSGPRDVLCGGGRVAPATARRWSGGGRGSRPSHGRERPSPREIDARVVDQKQVAAQREPFDHSLSARIDPPPVLDGAEPVVLLQTRRLLRRNRTARAGSLQVLGASLRGHMIDALFDRRVCAASGKDAIPAATGFRSI